MCFKKTFALAIRIKRFLRLWQKSGWDLFFNENLGLILFTFNCLFFYISAFMYGMFATLKKLGKPIPLSSILLAFGVWKPTLFWVMAKSPCFPRVHSSHVVQMIPYAFGIWVIKWQTTRFTSKYLFDFFVKLISRKVLYIW